MDYRFVYRCFDREGFIGRMYMKKDDMKMSFNDLGIPEELDWDRIRHLMRIGILAGLLALTADLVLGWGVSNESLSGFDYYFSRYLAVSDLRIIISAILGLVAIPLETLSYFAIYRLIVPFSKKDAHAYRSGLLGMFGFGAFTHVLCCMLVYVGKMLYLVDPVKAVSMIIKLGLWFLLPVSLLFLIFFILAQVVQIKAFRNGYTPYPKWCFIFNLFAGIVINIVLKLFGNIAFINALGTGWISLGSLWMLTGLLVMSKKLNDSKE